MKSPRVKAVTMRYVGTDWGNKRNLSGDGSNLPEAGLALE